MSPSTRSLVTFAALSISSVLAQAPTETFPSVPLASKHFSYPDQIPYRVDTDTNLIRGTQTGYNICNSTTEGPEALCQTSFLNSVDDFCLWAPKDPNSSIANTEGEEVAWCTKPGHGTRLIPAGALKGVQFIKTPDYVQVVGFIDQTQINIAAGDYGGELDPHGADLRGNPMGGLMYSNAFGTDNKTYTQVIEWTNFMGGDAFCIKACDPAGPNAAHFCEHIFDRIGCVYNMPNQAKNGTFESCLGENQDYPGVYVENGVTMTYKQPGETEIASPTYTPRIPSSSSCTQYASETLFAALGKPTAQASATPSASGSAGAKNSGKSGSPTGSNSALGAAATGNENGAVSLSVSVLGVVGVVFASLFLS